MPLNIELGGFFIYKRKDNLMKMIELKSKVFKFDNTLKFKDYFQLGEDDLVFVNKEIYEKEFKSYKLKCKYIIPEDYRITEVSDSVIDFFINRKKQMNIKRIIAVGDNSIVNISKILAMKNILYTKKLFENDVEIIKENELIVVPVNCRTNSGIIGNVSAEIKSKKYKFNLDSPEFSADYIALIPNILHMTTYDTFINESIDTFICAIQAYLSPNSNKFTDVFSIDTIRIIIEGYKDILKFGKAHKKYLIDDFLMASIYSGIAIESSNVILECETYDILTNVNNIWDRELRYNILEKILYNKEGDNSSHKQLNLNKIIFENLKNEDIEGFIDNNIFLKLKALLTKL